MKIRIPSKSNSSVQNQSTAAVAADLLVGVRLSVAVDLVVGVLLDVAVDLVVAHLSLAVVILKSPFPSGVILMSIFWSEFLATLLYTI